MSFEEGEKKGEGGGGGERTGDVFRFAEFDEESEAED